MTAAAASPHLLESGPADAALCFVLAHGAGQSMDSPFMTTVANGLADEGFRVIRFEFPYMARRRATGKNSPPDRLPVLCDCWREVHGYLRLRGDRRLLAIGGKSLGGRVASMLADELGVAGLVCLGYPFHPPGRPESLRTSHLEALRTPALICQGTRDPFGTAEEVPRYRLSPSTSLCWLTDGDHSFKPRKKSGHTEAGNRLAAISTVAAFGRRLIARHTVVY